MKGWRNEVVFDGLGGVHLIHLVMILVEVERMKWYPNQRVVYLGVGMSADGYIEERCMEVKKVTKGEITGSLIIARDDNMIQTVANSVGAIFMSAD